MNSYYFTFGLGQNIFKKYYVKIKAHTEDETRNIMFSNFGNKWCWCYNENTWNHKNFVKKYELKELKY